MCYAWEQVPPCHVPDKRNNTSMESIPRTYKFSRRDKSSHIGTFTFALMHDAASHRSKGKGKPVTFSVVGE